MLIELFKKNWKKIKLMFSTKQDIESIKIELSGFCTEI